MRKEDKKRSQEVYLKLKQLGDGVSEGDGERGGGAKEISQTEDVKMRKRRKKREGKYRAAYNEEKEKTVYKGR